MRKQHHTAEHTLNQDPSQLAKNSIVQNMDLPLIRLDTALKCSDWNKTPNIVTIAICKICYLQGVVMVKESPLCSLRLA